MLLFALVGGQLADRVDRRRLLGGSYLVLGMASATVAILIAVGHLSLAVLYALGFLVTTAHMLSAASFAGVLRNLVPAENMTRANARISSASVLLSEFVGPPLGALVLTWNAIVSFAGDALSFTAAGALFLALPGSFRANSAEDTDAPRGSYGEALRFLIRRPSLRVLLLMGPALCIAFTAMSAVQVLFALRVLGVSEVGYGVLVACNSVGAVLGGLAPARLEGRFGALGAVSIGLAGMALGSLGMTVVHAPIAAGALLVLTGASSLSLQVVSLSYYQRATPDAMLGRVSSLFAFFGNGAAPLGAIVGGFLARGVGLRAPYALLAVVNGLAALLVPLLGREARAMAPPSGSNIPTRADRKSPRMPTRDRESRDRGVVVALYGPKAVGKSAVAQALEAISGIRHVDADPLIRRLLEAGAAPDPIDGWLEPVQAAVLETLREHATASFEALGGWASDWRLSDSLEAQGYRVLRVLLKAPLDVTLQRLRERDLAGVLR